MNRNCSTSFSTEVFNSWKCNLSELNDGDFFAFPLDTEDIISDKSKCVANKLGFFIKTSKLGMYDLDSVCCVNIKSGDIVYFDANSVVYKVRYRLETINEWASNALDWE